jgi:hypothetical protein
MENPNHAHRSEDIEKQLYEELAAALAENQELIKKLAKLRSDISLLESLEQSVQEYEQSNSRLSSALKRWLSYVREAARRAD